VSVFNTNAVLVCNLKNLHAFTELPREEVPAARQTRDDLELCIQGAKISGHSKESLPVFVDVHRMLANLVRDFDAKS
jgi:hypothetical protein